MTFRNGDDESHYTISSITGGKIYKNEQTALEEDYKIIVAGYCRIDSEYLIPREIISLCQSYFRIEFDEWDAECSSINYKIRNKMWLSKQWDYGSSKWSNAFGCKTVERYGYNVWKIKIVEVSSTPKELNTFALLIGVVSTDTMQTKSGHIHSLQVAYNDVINMALNLTKQGKGTLSYTVNNKYLGTLFEEIDTDLDWKLAVVMSTNLELHLLQ